MIPSTSIAPERKAGTIQGIALLLPVTLSVMAVVVLAPVIPLMMIQFKDTPNADYWVPMVLTTPALCLVVCAPLAGYLGDLIGRRRVLLAAMTLYCGFGILPIFLHTLKSILISRIGVGIVESAVLTLSTTLIGDFFQGKARDRWLANQTAVASTAAVIFVYVGGVLGGAFGWRGPFAVYLSAIIWMLGVLIFTWEPRPDIKALENKGSASWKGFPFLRTGGICVITFIASVMFYIVQVEFSLSLQVHGSNSPSQNGLLQAIVTMGVILGTIIFQKSSRMPPVALLISEFFILGIGFIGMGKAPTVGLLVASATFNQIGAGMILPTLLTWSSRGLPFALRGRGMGIWQGVFSVGQFFMPLAVTFLSHHAGGLLNALSLIGAFSLLLGMVAMIGYFARPEARVWP